MNRLLPGLVGILVFSCCAVAQAPARTKGAIFKDDVDKLVGLVRDTARHEGLPSLGGDSVLATAKLLVAMGHCHRRYHVSDGPVVRPSLDFLIKNRKADGSFGDAAVTAWVAEALAVMDPDGFAEEIRVGQKVGGATSSTALFDAAVSQVLSRVRVDVFPQQLGAPSRAVLAGWIEKPAALDRTKAADVLLDLVACQVANKSLDAQKQPASAGAVAVFSPAQQKAFQWLWSKQKDGVFGKAGEASITAMTAFGLAALQSKPKASLTSDESAAIEKGLRWLLEQQGEDGTFGQQLPNYTTCVAVAALSRWDDPAAKAALVRAQRAILTFQNVESNGYQRGDRDYGSIGYGNSQRGDLSNLHFALGALNATGLPADHEAFAKAVVFLQRTQNLKSVNDFSGKVPDTDNPGVILDSTSGDDGGAGYYPGNSAAGYVVQPDGKSAPRSYGSMTYSLLKAYTLAGVKGDDPRVQAAVQWIRNNWTLVVNPGSDPALPEKAKYQGLYYYYMVLAQALSGAGVGALEVTDAEGKQRTVDWRKELRTHLEGAQQPDGSWLNAKNGRWMEDSAFLCTCYAMTALELCQ